MGGDTMASTVEMFKGAATGAVSALAVDTGLQMGAAPSWSNVTRELVRASIGTAASLAMLFAGVPESYAVGPAIANVGVSAVQAGRINDVAGRLRGAYAPH